MSNVKYMEGKPLRSSGTPHHSKNNTKYEVVLHTTIKNNTKNQVVFHTAQKNNTKNPKHYPFLYFSLNLHKNLRERK